MRTYAFREGELNGMLVRERDDEGGVYIYITSYPFFTPFSGLGIQRVFIVQGKVSEFQGGGG